MHLTFRQLYTNRIWQNNVRFSDLQNSACVMPFVCCLLFFLLPLHIAFDSCSWCFLLLFYCVCAGNTQTHKHTNTQLKWAPTQTNQPNKPTTNKRASSTRQALSETLFSQTNKQFPLGVCAFDFVCSADWSDRCYSARLFVLFIDRCYSARLFLCCSLVCLSVLQR